MPFFLTDFPNFPTDFPNFLTDFPNCLTDFPNSVGPTWGNQTCKISVNTKLKNCKNQTEFGFTDKISEKVCLTDFPNYLSEFPNIRTDFLNFLIIY